LLLGRGKANLFIQQYGEAALIPFQMHYSERLMTRILSTDVDGKVYSTTGHNLDTFPDNRIIANAIRSLVSSKPLPYASPAITHRARLDIHVSLYTTVPLQLQLQELTIENIPKDLPVPVTAVVDVIKYFSKKDYYEDSAYVLPRMAESFQHPAVQMVR